MKFIHIADLHLGKIAYGQSMLEDQEYILNQILDKCDDIQPDAAVIAGDIYDRSVPAEEAMNVFQDFLFGLTRRGITPLVISGNHDSAARLGVYRRFMDHSGIHIVTSVSESPRPVVLEDEYGPVNFYLLPFVKPYQVREAFEDDTVNSYEKAVAVAIHHMNINNNERNVAVAHQFVDLSAFGEAEGSAVGGVDKVSKDVFDGFDYVALGHIHKQWALTETIRYSGTPLKYSFDDDDTRQNNDKHIVVVTMVEKGNVDVSLVPLEPEHDMRKVRGTYDELVKQPKSEDYLEVTLTDETEILNGMEKLRNYFPNTLALIYDNKTTRNDEEMTAAEDVETRNPMELFAEFFQQRQGKDLSDEQKEILEPLFREVWEENE